MLQVVLDRGIALEICPTSNYVSGVVDSMSSHPIETLTNANILTTINTDDPLICDVTLSQEIALTMSALDISLDDMKQYQWRAVDAAFLDNSERNDLLSIFQNHMNEFEVHRSSDYSN